MVKKADSGSQTDSADVVIVGGGIGGCSLGAKLASSGRKGCQLRYGMPQMNARFGEEAEATRARARKN